VKQHVKIWLEIMLKQVTIKEISFDTFLFFSFELGCGKTISGSKTVYKSDAGGCGKGLGKETFTCA
jgi:hypothetical protein